MKRAWFLVVSLLVGCGNEFEPRDGRWNFLPGETIDESCGSITDMLSGDFVLTNENGGTFTILADNTTGVFACELSGKEFDCPEHLLRAKISMTDVTLDVTTTEVGSFTSETVGSGRRDARVVCNGSQCSLVAAVAKVKFPCTAAFEFMVEHAE